MVAFPGLAGGLVAKKVLSCREKTIIQVLWKQVVPVCLSMGQVGDLLCLLTKADEPLVPPTTTSPSGDPGPPEEVGSIEGGTQLLREGNSAR